MPSFFDHQWLGRVGGGGHGERRRRRFIVSLFAEGAQANGQGTFAWHRAPVQPVRVTDRHALKGLKNFFDFLIDATPGAWNYLQTFPFGTDPAGLGHEGRPPEFPSDPLINGTSFHSANVHAQPWNETKRNRMHTERQNQRPRAVFHRR